MAFSPNPLSSLDAILKDHYAGPVRDQLNNEMMIFDLFNRRKMTWTGRKVIMPVRTARNASGAYRADGGTLPDDGQNTYKDLQIEAKYLYGRMALTGPAIAQAKASEGAFLNALESELDGAIETVKNAADSAMFVGNGCVGFIHEHINSADHQFSGNIEQIPANPATVPCKVIRLDTYAVIHTGTVTQHATNAGEVTFNGAVNTSALGNKVACAVVCENDIAGNARDLMTCGIYSNLAGGEKYATPLNHFGTDRSTATGDSILQSTIRAVADDGARTSLVTPKSLQFMLDEIMSASGEMPDCMIAHYIFRQEYMGLLVQTVPGALVGASAFRKNVDSGDAGFTGGFSFNGLPLKVSRHCGKGLLIFLRTDSWLVTEVQSPELANLDGNVLSRVGDKDAYEAYVRYYYNLVCSHPNRNGILVGISYAGV